VKSKFSKPLSSEPSEPFNKVANTGSSASRFVDAASGSSVRTLGIKQPKGTGCKAAVVCSGWSKAAEAIAGTGTKGLAKKYGRIRLEEWFRIEESNRRGPWKDLHLSWGDQHLLRHHGFSRLKKATSNLQGVAKP
jgi:hypothetical protein